MKTVVTIPCFNTASHIEEIVRKCKILADEVVVIDDGSIDATADIAKSAGAFVIKHPRNLGYGEAIKSCFKVAIEHKADVFVTIDGDGQHSPEEIPELLRPILGGKSNLVIGTRFSKGDFYIPRYRRLGINVITAIWNFGSKTKVSDTQSGFRAYRTNLAKLMTISESGMSVSIEILEKARKMGVHIDEVPISCLYDHTGIGSKAVKHGVAVAFSVLRLRLKYGTRR